MGEVFDYVIQGLAVLDSLPNATANRIFQDEFIKAANGCFRNNNTTARDIIIRLTRNIPSGTLHQKSVTFGWVHIQDNIEILSANKIVKGIVSAYDFTVFRIAADHNKPRALIRTGACSHATTASFAVPRRTGALFENVAILGKQFLIGFY